MGRFKNQTVLVTGASRGLGRAMALTFADEGAYVCVGYRARHTEAEGTLAAITEAGGQGSLVALDVRDRASVEHCVGEVLAARGAIDVLVNNAGTIQDTPFALMSQDDWDVVLDTNLGGVFRCCRAVARSMITRRAGVVVNVASIAGMQASPGQANYSASKGGILALTRTLAVELAPYGVRVNAVVPGIVAAGMGARFNTRIARSYRERIPLRRFATPEEVARAVLFLASADASYVVGQALVVDGGLGV